MVHAYIKALMDKPYNFDIEQTDKNDEERYTYDCGDGLLLDIHIRKASMFWPGIKDGEKVARKDFPPVAKNLANELGKAFNVVKMDIGVPDSKFPTGDVEVSQEPEYTLPPEKPQVQHKQPVKPNTKQTQLTIPDKALTVTEEPSNVRRGFRFTERQVEAMKATVAKGATQAEFEMFIYLATMYRLDPFLKEIFFIPGNMKTILTSRDGYLKIAQSHKDFQGIRSMAVRAGDEFEIDFENDSVKHKFGTSKRGEIIGAWAVVYRKGMKPAIAFAEFSEYQGSTGPWKKYPSAMICKCAEAFALKRQFGISGLVTQEEMDVEAPEIIDPEFVTKEFIEDSIQDAQFEEVSEE